METFGSFLVALVLTGADYHRLKTYSTHPMQVWYFIKHVTVVRSRNVLLICCHYEWCRLLDTDRWKLVQTFLHAQEEARQKFSWHLALCQLKSSSRVDREKQPFSEYLLGTIRRKLQNVETCRCCWQLVAITQDPNSEGEIPNIGKFKTLQTCTSASSLRGTYLWMVNGGFRKAKPRGGGRSHAKKNEQWRERNW